MTEEVIAAAFELAATVVGNELRSRPERAVEVAKALLADLPTGPAIVRVNPADEAMMAEAATALAATRRLRLGCPCRHSGRPLAAASLPPGQRPSTRAEEALLRARGGFLRTKRRPGRERLPDSRRLRPPPSLGAAL